MVDRLPHGRAGVVPGFCPPLPSQQAATAALVGMGRKPRAMVLADCTIHPLRIVHRACWVADVAVPGKMMPVPWSVPAKPAARGRATVDFLDATSNRLQGELNIAWPATAPKPGRG